ncbi:hypothetical protein SUGI_1167910 [Cryptomeria japonica]|nr:hypothetical protein SUGI_1167910 [Cryptomeria japonica]
MPLLLQVEMRHEQIKDMMPIVALLIFIDSYNSQCFSNSDYMKIYVHLCCYRPVCPSLLYTHPLSCGAECRFSSGRVVVAALIAIVIDLTWFLLEALLETAALMHDSCCGCWCSSYN